MTSDRLKLSASVLVACEGNVRVALPLAMIALAVSGQVIATPARNQQARATFREAVEDYQVFVVAHCAPDEVRAYVAARADRDRAFVRSLRNTKLETDYRKAVSDRAKEDRSTVYECLEPPLAPPPAPALRAASSQIPPAQPEPQAQNSLAEHFAAGDRQFDVMMRLRDAALGTRGK
jgi:hypothetical protein